jgi:glycosyltransferase involved in cell wall biosynthesis
MNHVEGSEPGQEADAPPPAPAAPPPGIADPAAAESTIPPASEESAALPAETPASAVDPGPPPERPPIAAAAISAVFPARNAEDHLEQFLNSWAAYLDGLARDYEIIVVDDGSTDRTASLAEEAAARLPRLRLVRHPERCGFGAALRSGLQEARFPLLVYAPCSLWYQATDLDRFLKWIDNVDLVSGYRVGPNGHLHRSWSERLFRWLVRGLFGVRMRDLGCWFLLARRSIFARIPIQSDGPFAHAEILAKANFLGCLMSEVPVAYQPPGPGSLEGEDNGTLYAEFRRVFSRPDFGPPVLPETKDSLPPTVS